MRFSEKHRSLNKIFEFWDFYHKIDVKIGAPFRKSWYKQIPEKVHHQESFTWNKKVFNHRLTSTRGVEPVYCSLSYEITPVVRIETWTGSDPQRRMASDPSDALRTIDFECGLIPSAGWTVSQWSFFGFKMGSAGKDPKEPDSPGIENVARSPGWALFGGAINSTFPQGPRATKTIACDFTPLMEAGFRFATNRHNFPWIWSGVKYGTNPETTVRIPSTLPKSTC